MSLFSSLTRSSALGAALLAASALFSPQAHAQDAYPSRNLTIIVGFAAGSGLDVVTRFFVEKMAPLYGKPILIDNKPGASGMIATEATARARPDGYTIYSTGTGTLATIRHLWEKPAVDALKDFTYITPINRQTFFVTVDAKSDIKSIADLTALWKSGKGKQNYGTSALNAVVLGALYNDAIKGSLTGVPYRSLNDALNDLTGGNIDAIMADPQFALSQIGAGRVRGLAVASATRLQAAPDFPTMTESGMPMDLTSYIFFCGPANMPPAATNRLNAIIKEVVEMPDTKAFITRFGGDPYTTTPQGMRELIEREDKAWGEYIRLAKVPKLG